MSIEKPRVRRRGVRGGGGDPERSMVITGMEVPVVHQASFVEKPDRF